MVKIHDGKSLDFLNPGIWRIAGDAAEYSNYLKIPKIISREGGNPATIFVFPEMVEYLFEFITHMIIYADIYVRQTVISLIDEDMTIVSLRPGLLWFRDFDAHCFEVGKYRYDWAHEATMLYQRAKIMWYIDCIEQCPYLSQNASYRAFVERSKYQT